MTRGLKLALGSVQWGMPYGIANRTGQTGIEEIAAILRAADAGGVALIDTASGYGEAESRLGQLGAAKNFRITTKTLRLDPNEPARDAVPRVENAFEDSLQKLQTSAVHGLMVHQPEDLLRPDAEHLWEALLRLKAAGRVARIGASLYHPLQLEAILARFPVEIVQIPFSLYDQRFLQTGWLARLKERGVEVHARSAFLQGLLLLDPDQLPPRFAEIREHHRFLHARLRETGFTPLSGSLAFVLDQPDIDYVVLGCEKLQQFSELLALAGISTRLRFATETAALTQEHFINPSLWK